MAITGLYTFNGKRINLNEVSSVSSVVSSKENGKEVYYFYIILSGATVKSDFYITEALANTVRTAIISQF